MRARAVVQTIVLAAASLLAGCGGGGGPENAASCTSAVACGGDIVGEWTTASSCIEAEADHLSFAGLDCPPRRPIREIKHLEGTATFRADLTFELLHIHSSTVIETFDNDCPAIGGDCAAQSLRAFNGLPPTICRASGSLCICTTETPRFTGGSAPGTYTTTAEGLLTETFTGGGQGHHDYCVKGDKLEVSWHQDPLQSDFAPIEGTVVYTRN
jgi:hypothetical protein